MSDYNSAVRLQLELDELMNQQNTLLARLKDVDGKGTNHISLMDETYNTLQSLQDWKLAGETCCEISLVVAIGYISNKPAMVMV